MVNNVKIGQHSSAYLLFGQVLAIGFTVGIADAVERVN